jgi:hypothetical protein
MGRVPRDPPIPRGAVLLVAVGLAELDPPYGYCVIYARRATLKDRCIYETVLS